MHTNWTWLIYQSFQAARLGITIVPDRQRYEIQCFSMASGPTFSFLPSHSSQSHCHFVCFHLPLWIVCMRDTVTVCLCASADHTWWAVCFQSHRPCCYMLLLFLLSLHQWEASLILNVTLDTPCSIFLTLLSLVIVIWTVLVFYGLYNVHLVPIAVWI